MRPEILKFDFKQQKETDVLNLYIYSEVAPDGYDWWTGEKIESETSADFFRKKLEEYSDVKYINLFINSSGGYVKEGYGIYAQLKRHSAFKTVYVDGFANSIASIIAMSGDKRVMYINSVMGIHNMIDFCFGNAIEHRQVADRLDSMMEGNRMIYLERANGKISLEKLTELLDNETILTAEECLKYGFCDEIAKTASDPKQVMQSMQNISVNMESQIKYYNSVRQTFNEAMRSFGKEEDSGEKEELPEPIEKVEIAPPAEEPPPEEKQVSEFIEALLQ